MNGTEGRADVDCGDVRELVSWYPTQDLSKEERQRVEEHVAACPSCSDLLRFAADLKEHQLAVKPSHPDPDNLVAYAEDPDSISPDERSRIEEHLPVCAECRHEKTILETVDRVTSGDAPLPETAKARSGPKLRLALVERLRNLWDSLVGTLLRPIPAAAYLTVAVCAVLILLVRPAGEREPMTQPGAREGITARTDAVIESVVILYDRNGDLRGGLVEATRPIPTMDSGRGQFLLLEFTNLEISPQAEGLYQVKVAEEGSAKSFWQGIVKGESFIENYTLGLWLEPKTLEPGRYVVSVLNPADELIFRSNLIVQ